MTKFIEQRVDELENQVAKLELIIHELRGKKSIEPSTTTVKDIIEFEGKQYRKVDRLVQVGDVVVFTQKHAEETNEKEITAGKPYEVIEAFGEPRFLTNLGCRYRVYEKGFGRTSENVAVYELIKPKSLTPNQQRAAIIEKAKEFVKENVANGRTSNRFKENGNSTFRNNFYDIDFFVKERKVTAVVYWLEFNKKRISKPSNVGRAECSPNDVFNEHIGKAIALGRALGLDVSEFEQVVQPNEVVVGMEVTVNYHNETRIIEQLKSSGTVLFTNDRFDFVKNIESIINDTNAKYEVES
ncbi:hypothetical protein [Lysinibacillus irui]|uniref:hypothetical protein n=1 Tax=Lysinibacillus irui TaxID=2998077 RepID=UPI002AD3B891|nr:hypothetical protein [Lysinibacillus irui]MEA0564059.1 hypothetical protein [Lysinibacillus irui]